MNAGQPEISPQERQIYALLQAAALILVASSFVLVVLAESLTWRRIGSVGAIGFFVVAVVFNYARRFGIRVLWSKRMRGDR